MSDMSDYSPKSLCMVSEIDEFIKSNFILIYPQLEKMKSSDHLTNGLKDSRNRKSQVLIYDNRRC